jgi:hypothetical protein
MDDGLERVKQALRVTYNHPLESHTKQDWAAHKRPREGA